MASHVIDLTEDNLRDHGKETGLRLALRAILQLADDGAKVKGYKKLHGEPSETTLAKELEQFGSDFAPESSLGEALRLGLQDGVKYIVDILREDLLGHR